MNSPDNNKLTGAEMNTSPDGKAHAAKDTEGGNMVSKSSNDSARKYLIASDDKNEGPMKREDNK